MNLSISRVIWPGWLFLLVTLYCATTSGIAATPTTQDKGAWISAANNAFAINVYQTLAEQPTAGNLFFSPISIETALAMTYAGARGNTALQMAAVLNLPSADRTIHQDFGRFLDRLNATETTEEKSRGYQLSIANALWGQEGDSFLPDFVRQLEENYGAGLSEVDFKNDSEGTRETINKWVERKTNDKIKDLIHEGVLTPATRLVLTNAIYFHGNWASEFEKNATRDEIFHLSALKRKKIPLMHRTGSYGYMEQGDLQVLKLPYVGEELSMVVLLPNNQVGLAQLEKKLTPERLSEWFSSLRKREVVVFLPKFKATAQFELKSSLQTLGMRDAFDANHADFSGMTGNRDLCISKVIHKAFVEVKEEGTEAAAATGVVVELTAAGPPSPVPVFRADHPFLFFIRDEKSGAILFMGRLIDPEL